MAALTTERATKASGKFTHHHEPIPILDAVKIWKGSLVMLDTTTGEAQPGATATGKQGLGRAAKTVDNAADGLSVEVEAGEFWWGNSAAGDEIVAADIGALCYIVDDQTVAKTDGTATRSPAGKVMDVHATLGVLVATHPLAF